MTAHSRDTPQFYLTAPSPCPYLAGKEERKVFTTSSATARAT
jgi:leucyl-tRNA---protein transferase